MFPLLSPLITFFKIKNIQIYDNVFKLHSKLTVILLLSFSMLISTKQYFGSPIDCFVSDNERKSTIDTYCWILGTYINLKDYEGELGKDILYTGIGSKTVNAKDKNYQKYYQWVVFVFIIQALLFYLPAYLWKIWEGGRIRSLCENLGTPRVTDDWNEKSKMSILHYFSDENMSIHTTYAIRYFICEILNFLIVIGNIILVNMIFSEFWLNYAPAMNSLIKNDMINWQSYSARVFPRMAKCDIYSVGASGSMQIKDALCILPLNILNEKLFAFLWFWFIALALISGLNIAYRFFLLTCQKYRMFLLKNHSTRNITRRQIRMISKNGSIGECFILNLISKNLNPIIYKELIEELAKMNEKKKPTILNA